MIYGLFLDPRTWNIDFKTSPFWNPEKYGIKIDLHQNAFNIPKQGVDKKYKFVIASEVWEIPIQKTLQYLKNKGLKTILVPREIAPSKSHIGVMFNYEKFKYGDNYYFTPDLVLGAGKQYCKLWEGRAPSKTIGYPRFDVYLNQDGWKTREEILRRHKIEANKRIIFFPAYPPYHVQTINGVSKTFDLYDDLQNTLKALEQYSLSCSDVQIVVKIHPMSFKCYRKGIGSKKEVAGLLKQYYESPTKYMKVIGDLRNDSSVAREMIQIADVVVGYTSMMLLEAIIIGKPVLHLNLKQASELKNTLRFDDDLVTIYNNTLDKLPEYINMVDKLDFRQTKLVELYLYKVDGHFCKRLCSEIKRIV